VWPIEERQVPQSSVEGERTSPTQPFPTKPPAFDRQGVMTEDLIDFTPQLRKDALEFISKYDHGPLFTPPTERGTINVPGWGGGANWAGGALDPETGMLYVPSITGPISVKLSKPYPATSHIGRIGTPTPLIEMPSGLPFFKPPYGRITAIDLNKGSHAWMTPLGDGPRNHPLLRNMKLGKLGWPRRGWVLATKTLLFAGQETGEIGRTGAAPAKGHTLDVNFVREEKLLTAFDKRTGKLICEINLPSTASGALMTYAIRGKQYVVVPIGGGDIPAELVALSLP
jgi:quinoprotein glucose dehydrogenase